MAFRQIADDHGEGCNAAKQNGNQRIGIAMNTEGTANTRAYILQNMEHECDEGEMQRDLERTVHGNEQVEIGDG